MMMLMDNMRNQGDHIIFDGTKTFHTLFSGDFGGGITSSAPPRSRSVSGSNPSRRQPDILASAAAAVAKRRKMSLVGKPLTYKNYHTDQKYRRMQSKMHNFLERPRGWQAATYHLAV